MRNLRKNQMKLFLLLKEKNRLLHESEILDFYFENILRNNSKFNNYCGREELTDSQGKKRTVFTGGYEDYTLDDLKEYAKTFYLRALGVILAKGYLEFKIKEK